MKKNQTVVNFLQPCLMALSLLTRIPVTRYLPEQWGDKEIGYSCLWYPFVGALIALIIMLCAYILPEQIHNGVAGVVLLLVWVALTGALHLDGFADCIDAMYAGHSVVNKAETSEDAVTNKELNAKQSVILRVLKEPTIGTMAVVGLVLLLLMKCIILSELWMLSPVSFFAAIFASLVIARTQALIWLLTIPYSPLAAKTTSLGAILSQYVPASIAWLIIGVVTVMMYLLLPFPLVLCLLLILALIHYLWRTYWMRQLKGFVGDSIGALIEVVEVVVLLGCYFSLLSTT